MLPHSGKEHFWITSQSGLYLGTCHQLRLYRTARVETNTREIQRLLLAVRKSTAALSQRENKSLLWQHAPLGASESNDIFKNAILGGGRNITIQLCLNILRLSLRPLHQFFFSLQQWNKIDKVNFFTLKFNLSLVFLSKENAFCCSQPSPAIYHFIW